MLDIKMHALENITAKFKTHKMLDNNSQQQGNNVSDDRGWHTVGREHEYIENDEIVREENLE